MEKLKQNREVNTLEKVRCPNCHKLIIIKEKDTYVDLIDCDVSIEIEE